MYFPWCGLIEQIKLADIFIHYDDVQFTRGFYNRVQIKTPQGVAWITVPLRNRHRGRSIDELKVSYERDWIAIHRASLSYSYAKAKYIDEMLELFDEVVEKRHETLADLGRKSIRSLASYFGVDAKTIFLRSSDLGISGSSSQRLLDITRKLGGTVYLTGHGALNYLNHEIFEEQGIEVRYMKYRIQEYQQTHGAFTPYVSSLDAVAHLGSSAINVLQSTTLNWRELIGRSKKFRA
uniref:WbqC-like protein family protein n=1 Tax=Candidatus Kentrum sp. LFY TaxID=2126342 RepID=A0A450UPS5_9GAMM|nr:MAG: WbqC-like protein family protein [Candidatus Kentron sp. LFY]